MNRINHTFIVWYTKADCHHWIYISVVYFQIFVNQLLMLPNNTFFVIVKFLFLFFSKILLPGKFSCILTAEVDGPPQYCSWRNCNFLCHETNEGVTNSDSLGNCGACGDSNTLRVPQSNLRNLSVKTREKTRNFKNTARKSA